MTRIYQIIFLFTLLIGQAFANCHVDEVQVLDETACVSLNWIEGPYLNAAGQRNFSQAQFLFRAMDSDLDLSQVHFFLWMKMPHNHEHGGARIVVEDLGDGQYHLSQILLRQMRGQWFLRVDLSGLDHQDPKFDYDFEIPLTDWH